MTDAAATYHAFDRLVLTISESSLEGVRTDHRFELRSTGSMRPSAAGGRATGAEVYRSSVLHANGQACESEERYVGWLTARQVIELLVEIERSGVYEALPALGLVQGGVDHEMLFRPLVSMQLHSHAEQHTVLQQAPADQASVSGVVRAVREAVALAQERALTVAG